MLMFEMKILVSSDVKTVWSTLRWCTVKDMSSTALPFVHHWSFYACLFFMQSAVECGFAPRKKKKERFN